MLTSRFLSNGASAGLFAMLLSACGADASTDAAAIDVSSVDAAGSDVIGSCRSPGTGRVTVMLDIAPGLQIDPRGVWIAAMCLDNGSEHAVQIVQPSTDGSPVTLSGLGAGSYVFRASTPEQESVVSSRIDVVTGSSSVTTLSLSPGPAPIAFIDVSGDGYADAGSLDATSDATDLLDGASADGPIADSSRIDGGANTGSPDAWVVRAPVTLDDSGQIVGVAEATLAPHGSSNIDVSVRVTTLQCPLPCQQLSLSGAEIRVMQQNAPTDFAVLSFSPDHATIGATVMTGTQSVQGTLDDPTLDLSVAVFGNGALADGGAVSRDR